MKKKNPPTPQSFTKGKPFLTDKFRDKLNEEQRYLEGNLGRISAIKAKGKSRKYKQKN